MLLHFLVLVQGHCRLSLAIRELTILCFLLDRLKTFVKINFTLHIITYLQQLPIPRNTNVFYVMQVKNYYMSIKPTNIKLLIIKYKYRKDFRYAEGKSKLSEHILNETHEMKIERRNHVHNTP